MTTDPAPVGAQNRALVDPAPDEGGTTSGTIPATTRSSTASSSTSGDPASTAVVEPVRAPSGSSDGSSAGSEEPADSADSVGSTEGDSAERPVRPSGVPMIDVLRDAVAAVALLASLALPWTAQSGAADHPWVIVSVAVALLAIPLPYLARAGVLPSGWSVRTTRLARLVAAAPFAVVSVVYLVLDIARSSDSTLDRGVGTALGLGLAGALLVAQPRSCELGPKGEDVAAVRGWRTGLVVAAGLLTLGAIVAFVISLADVDHVTGSLVLLAVCDLLLPLVLATLPAFGALRGDAGWSATLIGIGAATAVLFLAGSHGSGGLLQVQSIHQAGFGLVLVPVVAAIAAGGAFQRSLGDLDVRSAVGRVLLVLAALGVVAGLTRVAALILHPHIATDSLVVTLVVSFLIAAVAVVALLALRTPGSGGRYLALLVVGTAVVAGTVAVCVNASRSFGSTFDIALLAYGLPAVLLVLLGLPAARGFSDELREGRESAYTWAPRPPRADKPAAFAVPPAAQRPAREAHAPADHQGSYQGGGAPAGYQGGGAPAGHQGGGAPAGYAGAPQDGYRTEVQVPVSHEAAPATGAVAAQATGQMPAVEPSQHDPVSSTARPYAQRPTEPVAEPVAPEPVAPEPVASEPVAPEPQQPVARRSSWDMGATPSSPMDEETSVSATTVLPAEAGFTATQAGDPSTSLEVLAQIAEHAPSLRPYVARNPSTYPALVDWLGSLGDPAVDAALRARTDR